MHGQTHSSLRLVCARRLLSGTLNPGHVFQTVTKLPHHRRPTDYSEDNDAFRPIALTVTAQSKHESRESRLSSSVKNAKEKQSAISIPSNRRGHICRGRHQQHQNNPHNRALSFRPTGAAEQNAWEMLRASHRGSQIKTGTSKRSHKNSAPDETRTVQNILTGRESFVRSLQLKRGGTG